MESKPTKADQEEEEKGEPPKLPALSDFVGGPEGMKEVTAMLASMGLDEEQLRAMVLSGQMDPEKLMALMAGATAPGQGPHIHMNQTGALASETGQLNGNGVDPSWEQPKPKFKSTDKARKDLQFSKGITKTEYQDSDKVLDLKLTLLAKWLKERKNQVMYAGAGMSVAAGINDVASKKRITETGSRLNLQPTLAHHILTSLYHKKYIKHVCHQNHDGLCQKAGLPLSALNEIHGSWFDKKNIVKQMNDALNPKNIAMLDEWEKKSDIVVAVGTSLGGMSADRMAQFAGENPDKILVIINFQETRLSNISQMNIFADINTVFKGLAKKLGVPIAKNPRVYEQGEFVK